jgi:hypothetical protein
MHCNAHDCTVADTLQRSCLVSCPLLLMIWCSGAGCLHLPTSRIYQQM